MPDVKLLSPEKVAELEALEAAVVALPLAKVFTQVGREVGRAYEDAMNEAGPSLLLAARLLPEMAKALVVLEGADDMPDWVEEFCRASLARYRALSPEQEGR